MSHDQYNDFLNENREIVCRPGETPIDLSLLTAVITQVRTDRARIDTLKAENERLRGLCVKSDGLFGLWRYRFKSTPMPDDLIREIEEHIGQLRRASKGEPHE